tara:strand:- start:3089 stop:3364 length:276 start_codon:yes stop_codon:yes gene_type:complete
MSKNYNELQDDQLDMTAAKSNNGNDDLLNMSRVYDNIGVEARASEKVEIQSEVVSVLAEKKDSFKSVVQEKKDSFKKMFPRGTLTFGSEGV